MASERSFGRLASRASTVCVGISLAAGDVPDVMAANECGAGTNVTCTSASNPYTLGISYSNANQTVSLATGVSVSGFVGVSLSGTGTQTLNLATGVVVNPSIGNAISIANSTGTLTIGGDGSSITANGGTGISAVSTVGPISITTGSVAAGNGTGINTRVQSGNGAITLTANGNVSGTAGGISAVAQGTGAVGVTTKAVSTTLDNAAGVFAQSSGGTVTVNTTAGTVSTLGAAATAVTATFSGSSGAASITTGAVSTQGNLSIGVAGLTHGPNAALSIDTRGGAISTAGTNATGINAVTGSFPGTANAGAMTIQVGNITATNAGAIVASANGGAINITASGAINSSGDGINTQNVSLGPSVTTTINVTGSITTSGASANGINANVVFGAVNAITVSGSINATGASGAGILSSGEGDSVTISPTGSVSGASGIQMANTGPATISNSGTVTGTGGSAIQIFGANDSTYTNRGTVNGSVAMGSGNDTVVLYTQSVNNGIIDGQTGTNTLRFAGTTTGSIDLAKLANFQVAEKIDSGSWSLTGTGGFSTSTTVTSGTLSVNGTLTTPLLTVQPGGTLGGSGKIIGNTTINGGTLSPGNSPGTLTVQGNLVFTAASTYLVEVDPTIADRTNVTGSATLGGATVRAVFAAGSYVSKQYAIVNATGGVIGSFANLVNTSLPSNFTASLSYDAANAYLNLSLHFTPSPPGPQPPDFGGGLNVNQQNVAGALVGFFNRTGGIPLVFGALTPAGLTQASGEIATRAQQAAFDTMNLFLGLITDPFIAGRSNDPPASRPVASQFADDVVANAYVRAGSRSGSLSDALAAIHRKAPPLRPVLYDPRWSVWAASFGGSQNTRGNTVVGSNDATDRVFGTAVGADYLVSPRTRAGFAMAGSGTQFGVANSGSGRLDVFQAGVFMRHDAGAAYVTAALAYGWHDVTTNRTVTIAGTDQLQAHFDASSYSGRVESGYRLPWSGEVGIAPYAAGQFTSYLLPSYAEQVVGGAGTFALTYVSRSVTDSRSELGVRTDKTFAIAPGAIATLRARLAWAHDFSRERVAAATFQTLPGAGFIVNGVGAAPDSALASASAELKWSNGWSAMASFEGSFAGVSSFYAGKGALRYSW